MPERTIRILAGLMVAASLAPAPASAAKVCAFAMPADMVSNVYSGSARAGQEFRFRVTGSSVLDDGTSVPAGTLGYGIVRAASSAGRHSHDGMIALEPRYLVLPKGAKQLNVTMNPTLPVTWTPREPLLNKAASHVPLPVPGMVMTGVNTLRWGKNITLGPGFTFSVIPVGNLARGAVC